MDNHTKAKEGQKHTLAQKRAFHAYKAIEDLKRKSSYGKYVSYVKGLPATIIFSGLGQALAMEKMGAQKDSGHELLYRHIDIWLREGWENSPYKRKEFQDIVQAIVSGCERDYIRAQAEAIEYLAWLKKFAVAELEEEKS